VVNVGPLEILLVAIIALIVLGPQRLPEVARSVGRGMREFRQALSDAGSDDDQADDEDEELDDDEADAVDELEPAPEEDYQKDAESSEPSSSSSGLV
jgi:sec-independent protein translocase protein TatA